MKLTSYLVKKYLRFDKSQPFITITAVLAFLGVAIGLMVLMVAMAIMNGMSKEFEKKLFTMNYPLTIYPRTLEKISDETLIDLQKKFPELKYSPYITTQVIVKKGDKLEGGLIFGVDFERESRINDIVQKSVKDKKINKYNLIMGKGIKDDFSIEEGSKVTLIFTKGEPGGFSLMPTMKRFKAINHFESGLQAYDKSYMYTTIDSLVKVLKYDKGTYDGIHIYSNNPQEDIKKIKEALPFSIGVVGWWQLNGNFFSAMELEKRALFIVLMLIILIASLNIVSSLLMTVMNRRKEIALLLSLGAYKKEIKNTFFYLGLAIGGSGIVMGIMLGFLTLFVLGTFDIISLPADVYGTAKLPLELSFTDFIFIVIGAVGIVSLSSYYPSKKAIEIDVLTTLRNE